MHHHEESCKDLNNSKIGNWRYFNKKVVEIYLHGGRQRFHGIACSISRLDQFEIISTLGYVVRLQSQIKHTITICKVLYMGESGKNPQTCLTNHQCLPEEVINKHIKEDRTKK